MRCKTRGRKRYKEPSTNYDHFMRVCTCKNEENEKWVTMKICSGSKFSWEASQPSTDPQSPQASVCRESVHCWRP